MGIVYDLPSKVFYCKCGRILSVRAQDGDRGTFTWLEIATGSSKKMWRKPPETSIDWEQLDEIEIKAGKDPDNTIHWRPKGKKTKFTKAIIKS